MTDPIDNQRPTVKGIVAKLVPKRLLTERNIFLRLGQAGSTYAKLRVLDAMRLSPKRSLVPPSATSFLLVCHGNIMRSPMAEHMLKRAFANSGLSGMTVLSAGIHATPGSEAHPRARLAAREFGLPLDEHRSTLLTEEMMDNADAVFGMDFQNQAELLTRFPQVCDKIFMMSDYAEGAQRGRAIPDPYYGDEGETLRCYKLIETCVNNLAKSLSGDQK